MFISDRTKRVIEIALADPKASLEFIQALEIGSALKDETELSQSYQQDVIIDGDAIITSDIIVHGSLIARGKLVNKGGHQVTIYGDLVLGGSLLFTPENDDTEQKDVWVLGDVFIGESSETVTNEVQYPATILNYNAGLLRVTISDDFQFYGIPEPLRIAFTSGVLTGYEDSNVTYYLGFGDRLLLSATPPSNPVPGEDLVAIVQEQTTTITPSEFKVNKGQNFTFFVGGDLICWGGEIFFTGKDGAKGLHLDVGGDLIGYQGTVFYFDGGPATETDVGGAGADVVIRGRVSTAGINLKGGSTAFTGMAGGNGGNLEVHGNCKVDSINISGGPGPDSGGQPGGSGGDGGTLIIRGDLVTNEVRVDGGGSDCDDPLAAGGVGGSIEIFGDLTAPGALVQATGGTRAGNTSGYVDAVASPNGGSIIIHGNAKCFILAAVGHLAPCAPKLIPTEATAAQYKFMEIFGPTEALTLVVEIVDPTILSGFRGGNAGSITIRGRCISGQGINAVGGTLVEAGNALQRAGDGGGINLGSCSNSSDNPALEARGGEVSTGATASGRAGDGGTIHIQGPASSMKFITVAGGNRLSGSGSDRGGNGGTIKIGGPLTVGGPDMDVNYIVSCDGGNTNSGNGGNAGLIVLHSHAAVEKKITANGGNGTAAGSGGTIELRDGAAVYDSVEVKDGTGTAATAASRLIGGLSTIKTINMTSRAAAQIRASSLVPALLKVNALTAKNILTNHDGTGSTANLTTAIADSIFSYDIAGKVWYRHQGTAA